MKKKMGRPAYQPTQKDRDIVEALAGYGIPAVKIALVIGIAEMTLRLHFRTELDRGAAMVEAKLVGNLLRLAGGTDGTALKAIMFSLQARFGWSPYAPAPEPKPEPLGKKEQAVVDAHTAHEDSGWSDLVH